jgi:hypothetical protein
MDSRLRGNDNRGRHHLSVIPAQAGIHDKTTEKFKENIYITSDFANFHMVSCEIHYS